MRFPIGTMTTTMMELVLITKFELRQDQREGFFLCLRHAFPCACEPDFHAVTQRAVAFNMRLIVTSNSCTVPFGDLTSTMYMSNAGENMDTASAFAACAAEHAFILVAYSQSTASCSRHR
jgi:hypothetical protein